MDLRRRSGKSDDRLPIVDLVRFASIVMVIGHHYFPGWIARTSAFRWVGEHLLVAFRNGAYGVSCFFVVSGFLITKMLANEAGDFLRLDLGKFYVRRAARIFPLLGATVLLGLVFSGWVESLSGPLGKFNFWKMESGFGVEFWGSLLTFTFNWFVVLKQPVIFIGLFWCLLWSLAVEEQFYFFYPFVLKSLGSRARIVPFLVSVILSGFFFRAWAFYRHGNDLGWGYTASFAAFDQIAIGALLFFLWWDLRMELASKPVLASGLMGMGGVIVLLVFTRTSIENGAERVLAPTLVAAGCALLILGGLHAPGLNSTLVRCLAWPGKFSYGCYLWHLTVMFFMLPFLTRLGGFSSFLLLLGSVGLVSYLSYRWFEVPANDLIRGWFGLKPSKSL